jgi:plasmid maintenance system antidote protein VapI
MKLTDDFLKNVAPADSKAGSKYGDGKSLFLLVNNSGKYWRMNYRFAGKRKTVALGVYPAVSIEVARLKSTEARALVRAGIDPVEAKRADRQIQRLAVIGPRPRHPGAILGEMLLGRFAGMPVAFAGMNQLLNESSPMTCDVALHLEHLLAIKAEKWMALQQAVDLWNAREKFQRMREIGKSLQPGEAVSNNGG